MMRKGIERFVRYSVIGGATFLLDLGMLYVAVSMWNVLYYVATPITFLIAVTGNYALSRAHVFKGTERSWHGGYLYFITIALTGAAVTTFLVAFLVTTFGLYYLYARILVAGIVGIANYLFNLHLNFDVAGKH